MAVNKRKSGNKSSNRNNVAAMLGKFNFKKAREAAAERGVGGGGDFFEEPGVYTTKLTKLDIGKSQAGNARAMWYFKITEHDEYEGEVISKLSMLDDEDRISYFLSDLARFGYDPADIEPGDLAKIAAELNKLKPEVVVRVKPWESGDKSGVNVYINKVVEDDEADEDDDDGDDEVEVDEDEEIEEEDEEIEEEEDGEDEEEEEEDDDDGEEEEEDEDADEEEEDEDEDEEDEDEEDEGEEDDDDEIDYDVGSRIEFKSGRGTATGTIKKMQRSQAVVKHDRTGALVKVPFDKIEYVLED